MTNLEKIENQVCSSCKHCTFQGPFKEDFCPVHEIQVKGYHPACAKFKQRRCVRRNLFTGEIVEIIEEED